uniref:Exocyst subunit Exo70 family protein n=1 Tax=Nelumbo nucifera TaxID=4432 RepID=A0A822Y329_NELNU|nr:TPA_asm: hypothetical protein HUJ06_027428 [Nelumbo nucifera]
MDLRRYNLHFQSLTTRAQAGWITSHRRFPSDWYGSYWSSFANSMVRTSNLRYLLGEDWISNHEAMVKQYAASYERMGWNNVFSALPENPGAVASKEEAKEHFKRFSSAFEEAYRKQSSWVVTDGRLRDEIKLSIAKKLVPAYRELYDRYRIALSDEKNVHGVVRFAPDDLGNYLSDLFYGTGASGSTSSSSSSRSRGWRSQ